MITYEIRVYDYAYGSLSFGVHSFTAAVRLFDAISLDDFLIYQKDLISHDWSRKLQYVVRSESF